MTGLIIDQNTDRQSILAKRGRELGHTIIAHAHVDGADGVLLWNDCEQSTRDLIKNVDYVMTHIGNNQPNARSFIQQTCLLLPAMLYTGLADLPAWAKAWCQATPIHCVVSLNRIGTDQAFIDVSVNWMLCLGAPPVSKERACAAANAATGFDPAREKALEHLETQLSIICRQAAELPNGRDVLGEGSFKAQIRELAADRDRQLGRSQ
jgi:hypothetical protein